MNTDDLGLLNHIYDWHQHCGPKPLPCAGMDYPEFMIQRFMKAYTREYIHVPMGYEHDLGRHREEGGKELFVEASALPLISAAMHGFSRKDMAQIAQAHAVSARDFLLAFEGVRETLGRGYDLGIPATEVLRRCVNALEMVTHAELEQIYVYEDEMKTEHNLVMTSAKSPKLWPKTVISSYAKANIGSGTLPAREFSTIFHNFINKLVQVEQLPHDEKGPRIDWFLDRSGMLLPAVTTKALGYFDMWEDLVFAVGQKKCPPVLHQIMDYCLDNPPLALRTGISSGIRGMSLNASESITDGLVIHDYLRQKLPGTWLESVLSSDILKLNILGTDDKPGSIAALNGIHTVENMLWNDQACLSERVFREIGDTRVELIGFAHFDAVGYLSNVVGHQTYPADFPREKILTHLLNGLSNLVGNEALDTEEAEEVRELAVKNSRMAIRLLGHEHDFDYTAFAGVCSLGVRLLAEEGLDMKKLPKMSNRDKGQLLENDLGM